jgi:hypothetical protein
VLRNWDWRYPQFEKSGQCVKTDENNTIVFYQTLAHSFKSTNLTNVKLMGVKFGLSRYGKKTYISTGRSAECLDLTERKQYLDGKNKQ